MDKLNYAAVFVASLMPIFFGFIYYHPKTFGNIWMQTNGFTQESLQGGPRPVLMLAVYVMSLMLSLWCGLQFMDIHQTSLDFNDQPHDWNTWQHGFVHGFALTLFVVLPLLGINAVFERRSLTYVAVHTGYWFVTLCGMNALLSGWR